VTSCGKREGGGGGGAGGGAPTGGAPPAGGARPAPRPPPPHATGISRFESYAPAGGRNSRIWRIGRGICPDSPRPRTTAARLSHSWKTGLYPSITMQPIMVSSILRATGKMR